MGSRCSKVRAARCSSSPLLARPHPHPRSQPRQLPAPSEPDPDAPRESAQPPDAVRIDERVEVSGRLTKSDGDATPHNLEPAAIRETAGGFENVFQVLQGCPARRRPTTKMAGSPFEGQDRSTTSSCWMASRFTIPTGTASSPPVFSIQPPPRASRSTPRDSTPVTADDCHPSPSSRRVMGRAIASWRCPDRWDSRAATCCSKVDCPEPIRVPGGPPLAAPTIVRSSTSSDRTCCQASAMCRSK